MWALGHCEMPGKEAAHRAAKEAMHFLRIESSTAPHQLRLVPLNPLAHHQKMAQTLAGPERLTIRN